MIKILSIRSGTAQVYSFWVMGLLVFHFIIGLNRNSNIIWEGQGSDGGETIAFDPVRLYIIKYEEI